MKVVRSKYMKSITTITALFIGIAVACALAADQGIGFQMRPLAEKNSANAIKHIDNEGNEYWVQNIIIASMSDLERASPRDIDGGLYYIDIFFRKDKANKLYEITKPYVGKGIEVVLNGRIFLIRHLFEPLSGDGASITGNYSQADAQRIADELNAKIANLKKTPNKSVHTDAE